MLGYIHRDYENNAAAEFVRMRQKKKRNLSAVSEPTLNDHVPGLGELNNSLNPDLHVLIKYIVIGSTVMSPLGTWMTILCP